ncbi:MAG: hypothetical protein LBQ46_10510, partial [Treponema sp.]|nr:hypothetical protein [Treponema sp.]
GQSRNFASLEQGTYRLFIFAGSYNWDYYEDNNMVGSIPMNWKRITYDCGDLFITAKSRKVYNFDPYIAGVNDRDTPHGMVKLVLNNGGSTTGSGYSGTLTQVQIISGSTISGKITETSPAYVLDISRPTPTDPTLQSSATDVDKGGPENRTSGGFVPPRYVVIDRAEPLTPGNSLTFFVPPGIYGMRVFNPQGGGPEDAWYGRKSDRYLDLYLVEESSKTIVINWYQPHGLQIITSTSGIAYKQVTDLNLSGALKAPAVGHPLQPRIEQGAYSQYYSADIRWYYSTGIQGPITDHYWLPDSPSHVRSPSPIQYPHFISDITTHNVKVGDYYSAVVTLIPESGYTYAGLRPSTEGSGNIKTTGTSPFAYNNYPLRSMGWWLSSWLATDGALKNEAAQKDGSIKVVIHFPILR